MRCSIITIGDEILIGQTVDTNSAWLGEKLNNMGFEKSLHIGNICGAISVEYLGGSGTKEKFKKIHKLIKNTI